MRVYIFRIQNMIVFSLPSNPPSPTASSGLMLLQKMRTPVVHSQTRRRWSEAAENDVTCVNRVTVKVAHGSPLGRSISINDSRRASTTPGASILAPPDPHPSKAAKSRRNDCSPMNSCKNHDPVHIAAASCLPHEDMWSPCEPIEIPDKTPLEVNKHVFNAMRTEDSSWAEYRDREVLRDYFRDPTNIVLHSTCPHITPHIVITPAVDTPEDFYTPWNNRTLPQWSGFLMVPPYDLTTGRLHSPSNLLFKKAGPLCASDDTIINEDSEREETAAISSNDKKHAFCRSRFASFVESTANERLILYHVVKALQKHQCKAAAYAASARLATFCRRYEMPELLDSIERPFVWVDPAEPILRSNRQMLGGAIIIESSSPLNVPHIIINTAPPQNPWIPWYNVVTDPQDGHFLTVSPRVNYINVNPDEEGELPEFSGSSRLSLVTDVDEEEDGYMGEDADYEDDNDSEEDHSPPSRPGSPGPETPTDDSASLLGFFSMRPLSFAIDEDDEDRALALSIAKAAVEEYYQSSLRCSLPVIEEEDSSDEEGFPPLYPSLKANEDEDLPLVDNWYSGAPARTSASTIIVL